MASPISTVCFVGVYGSNQNPVLRQGLAEHDVSVIDAGVSTRDGGPSVAGRELPLYPMKPTLNWFGRFPSWLFPVLFLVAFAFHAVVTWAAVLANPGAVRRADVLVVPHFGDTAVLLVKPLALLLGTPVVYVSHNGLYCTLVENREAFAPDSVAGRTIWLLDAAIQRAADRVLVFSEHSRTVLSDWFGVPESRYAAVYIGVDRSKFSGESAAADVPDVDVLYWGNFIPHHGVETMVRAAAALPDHDFVFAGKSAQRESVVELADRLGADNVTFPGFLSDAELEATIRAADVVLGPLGDYTQTRMNVGTKVAEAASLRKAIALGDHPAPNEVFEHRHSAYLVEPESEEDLAAGIEAVLSADELRERLEAGSHEVSERYFTPDAVAVQFLAAAEPTLATR
jgi:glycosyltransferase involved in cell wall biosynthesis